LNPFYPFFALCLRASVVKKRLLLTICTRMLPCLRGQSITETIRFLAKPSCSPLTQPVVLEFLDYQRQPLLFRADPVK